MFSFFDMSTLYLNETMVSGRFRQAAGDMKTKEAINDYFSPKKKKSLKCQSVQD